MVQENGLDGESSFSEFLPMMKSSPHLALSGLQLQKISSVLLAKRFPWTLTLWFFIFVFFALATWLAGS